MDSKTVLQPIQVNLESDTLRVSGELSISQFSVVRHLHDLSKSIQKCQILPHIFKYYKLLTHHSIFCQFNFKNMSDKLSLSTKSRESLKDQSRTQFSEALHLSLKAIFLQPKWTLQTWLLNFWHLSFCLCQWQPYYQSEMIEFKDKTC